MTKQFLYALEPFKWRKTEHGDWNEYEYPIGTKVEIIGYGPRGYDVKIVETGVKMCETGLMMWSREPIHTEKLTMTDDEEKSNEIAAEYLMGHDRLEVTYEEMREAVMEMAQWKDQQFKDYLKFRKIECLRTAKIVYSYDMSSAGELEIKAKCYDEIINDLFGETEQDNSDREE